MNIYMGSVKAKMVSNNSSYQGIHLIEYITSDHALRSSDDYLLMGAKGCYLIPKEDDEL